MKALKLYGANDLRLVSQEMPVPGAGEVVIRVKAASICGTDVRMWKNGTKAASERHPLTLGHEFAGIIESVGEGVRRYEAGMRAAVQPNTGCGVCACCLRGYRHLCRDYEAFGVTFDGAFAEYVRVPASSVAAGNLIVLPEELSFAESAVAEPLSCIFNGCEKLTPKPGETALVIGAGPIGIGHAMLLGLHGVNVIMADLEADRLKAAGELVPGIVTCLSRDMEKTVWEATGGLGADIAVVACPSPQAQAQAVTLMNIHGRVSFFGGIPAGKQPVAIDTNLVHYRELTLTGSTRSSLEQYARVLALIRQGRLNAKGLITHTHSFDGILDAFDQAARAEGLKHVICFD